MKKITKQDLKNYIISEANKIVKAEILKEESKYTNGKHLINVDAEVRMDRETYKEKISKGNYGSSEESLKFIEEVTLLNPYHQNSIYSHVSYAICEYTDLIGRSAIVAVHFGY